jgi:MYXO-CTERM domain-containing protein
MGLLLFIVLTVPQELGLTGNPNPTRGMILVGLAALGFLLGWRRRVLRSHLVRPRRGTVAVRTNGSPVPLDEDQ